MFIYFLEQVWNLDGLRDYSRWNEETKEIQARYWDWWHACGYEHYSVYPFECFEHENDYTEW